MFYNNAGTPTALGTGPNTDTTVYTLYVSNNDLNTVSPTYIAVMNNAVFNTTALANTAITNGTTARATNELLPTELAQLGYAIVVNNGTNGYVDTLIVAKSTFNSKIIGSGASTSSALISNNTSNFNGHLSSADTTVQIALNTLDDWGRTDDIKPQSFSGANNQVVAADVTNLLFSTTTVRAFEILISISLVADASKYEVYTLRGIYNGSTWDMSQTSNGDNSGIVFSITNAGQIQYTSPNSTGFVSLTMNFRAITVG